MPPDSPNPSPTQEVERFWTITEPQPGALLVATGPRPPRNQQTGERQARVLSVEDHQRLLQAEVEKRGEAEEEAGDLEAASVQRGDRVIELERRWVDVRGELERRANNHRIPVHAQNAYLVAARLLRDKDTEQGDGEQ